MEGRICAVVVTYNRKDLILECLNALRRQTYSLDAICVIDNGSTDGTQELFMKEGWITETVSNKSNESIEKVFLSNGDNFRFYYIRIKENCGSSGGFYEGMKRAYEKGYDWIWVMDDDALPKLDALEKLVEFGDDSLAAMCSVVVRRDTNEIELVHRRIFNKWTLKEKPVRLENYQRKYFYFNEFSYVGTLINSKAIKVYGFTDKSFFFQYEDTEHSLRLSKYGKIICVTSSYVLHGPKSKSEVETNIYDYRRYYSIRNRIFVLKKYGNPFTSPFYIGFLKLCNYAGKILKRRDEVIYNLYNEAILDGLKGNLGIKMPYLPDVWTHIKNE